MEHTSAENVRRIDAVSKPHIVLIGVSLLYSNEEVDEYDSR
jgi:hypothetical protein